MEGKNRWLIAIMGTLLMVVLGSIYSWSFFQKPIVEQFGWSNSQVAWVFSTSITFLGLAAAWGGINLPKYGPRKLAILGSIMWGLSFVIGGYALSIENLPLLIIGIGVIGGIGLGLGYVTPVVTAAKWFPDKKGFVTGMVVMGFGFGALAMSKILAPAVLSITDNSLVVSFYYIGVIMLVLGFCSAIFIVPPPADYVPAGYTPPAAPVSTGKTIPITAKSAVMSGKFILMWLVFFINIIAGIMLIGFQSPMMQDIYAKYDPGKDVAALAAIGATLIAITSIFNGVGRFFWGSLSDKIGRVQAFRLILLTQIIVFGLLMFISNPYIFGALFCIVLLCYGGGFGTMPAFVGDVFGPVLMPVVYGIILTAWSAGGIVGPQIAAIMKDTFPESASLYSFIAAGGLLIIGLIITFFLNNEPLAEKEA